MKGRKTTLSDAQCGIARSLGVIGDWWSLLIVRDAFNGRRRFNEFQKSLGLARNILSSRLKKLVDEGILQIVPAEGSPAYHHYVLTEKGEQLHVILVALWQWGEENCFRRGELKIAMVDNRNDAPLPRLEVRARDGRLVGPRDFRAAPRSTLTPSKPPR